MNKEKIISALKNIVPLLQDYKYSIVGTTNLLVQGIDVEPSDIDILTTDDVIQAVNATFKGTLSTDPDYGYLKSNFFFEEVDVELVSCEHNVLRSRTTLDSAKPVTLGGVSISCTDLRSEIDTYTQMGRDKDLLKIKLIQEQIAK